MTEDHMVIILIALINAISAFFSFRAHQLSQKIEVSMNSMKDKLVQTTADASFAAGEAKARLIAETKAEKLLEKDPS